MQPKTGQMPSFSSKQREGLHVGVLIVHYNVHTFANVEGVRLTFSKLIKTYSG